MPGAEWALVAVTTDLHSYARGLRSVAGALWQESRRWSHVRGRAHWEEAARTAEVMSQAAALAAVTGDYWSRLEAMRRAEQELAAAELTLGRAARAGDLWNDHTMAPLPARIDPEGRLRL